MKAQNTILLTEGTVKTTEAQAMGYGTQIDMAHMIL